MCVVVVVVVVVVVGRKEGSGVRDHSNLIPRDLSVEVGVLYNFRVGVYGSSVNLLPHASH